MRRPVSKKLVVSIPDDLFAALRAESELRGVAVSEIVRDVLGHDPAIANRRDLLRSDYYDPRQVTIDDRIGNG